MRNKMMFGTVLLATVVQGCSLKELTRQKNEQIDTVVVNAASVDKNIDTFKKNYETEMQYIRWFAILAANEEVDGRCIRFAAAKKIQDALGGPSQELIAWGADRRDRELPLEIFEVYGEQLKRLHAENKHLLNAVDKSTDELLSAARVVQGFNKGEQLERFRAKQNVSDAIYKCGKMIAVLLVIVTLVGFKFDFFKWKK